MKRILLFFLGLATLSPGSDNFPPLFPFLISYDGPDNASGVAHLLDAPAGKHGFVRVENGCFVNDAGPVRFFGTNLTGPANFPSKEAADKLAGRLARFGINCVRLHYFDSEYRNFLKEKGPGIFTADPVTQRNFDPEQVDRQDYLIAALKKRGIFVNINLHVARWWDERDGFTGKELRPRHDKGVDLFEPRMIALQKEYARQLLAHVNPYTGLAYAEDPCVALIEINNENGLFNQYHEGGIDRLPEPYAGELCKQWNEWLRRRYVSTDELRNIWMQVDVPLAGEQIRGGAFDLPGSADGKSWSFISGSADAVYAVHDGVFRLEVTRNGDDPFPELFGSLAVRKGQPYTLSFRIRKAEGEGDSRFELYFDDEQNTWLRRIIRVGSEWKNITCSFFAGEDCDALRFALNRFRIGVYEVDDLSFRHGAKTAGLGGARFEDGSIPIVKSDDFVPLRQKHDFYRFMMDTERAYWMGMYRFLKDELGVKAPISGTQLGGTHFGYGPAPLQAELDYVDNHSYWCHPSPVNPDWKIGNISMVNSLANIQRLASMRVYGEPYTVSEYNHPFPNQYGAEAQPMISAYGALQGWNGIFQYTYNHSTDPEPVRNTYFFSMIARTDVLAHFPACAALFLRGDVQEGKKSLTGSIEPQTYFEKLADWDSIYARIGRLGFDERLCLVHKTAMDVTGRHTGSLPSEFTVPKGNVLVSDTGELTWNTEIPGAAFLAVSTANTKLFTGFPQERTITLGDGVSLNVGRTKLGWATVSLVSRHATGFGESGRPASILIAATGLAENRGSVIEKVYENRITLKTWGDGAVLVEGVPATITLPSDPARTKCFALDPFGHRNAEIPIKKAISGGSEIVIGPEYRTVWYEIEVKQQAGLGI
jgi:hypothetical protein